MAALLRRAKAWEMESKEGGARSSSRQMGSEEIWGGRRGTWGEGAAPGWGVDLWTNTPSLGLVFGVGTIFFLAMFPVR